METNAGELKVYGIVTGKDHTKTVILAHNTKNAIRKFFWSFKDLRSAVIENDVGAAIKVTMNKTTQDFATLPFLVILNAVTMEEGIQFMINALGTDKELCKGQLKKSVQKCQWVIGKDEILSENC